MRSCIVNIVLLLIWTTVSTAQTRAVSPAKSFSSRLLVDASLNTRSQDATIEAGEWRSIGAVVRNTGASSARRVVLRVQPENPVRGLVVQSEHDLGDLSPGEHREAVIPFAFGESVPSGKFRLLVQAAEESVSPHPVCVVEIRTVETLLPRLVLEKTIRHPEVDDGGRIARDDTVEFDIKLVNNGVGTALDVAVLLVDPDSGLRLYNGAGRTVTFGALAPGESRNVRYLFSVNPEWRGDSVRVGVRVVERRQLCSVDEESVLGVLSQGESLVRKGKAAMARGDLGVAMSFFTRAIDQEPLLPSSYVELGLAYATIGDNGRCRLNMMKASELGDSAASLWLQDRRASHAPRASYERLVPDPFKGITPSTGLAVFPIVSEDGMNSALTEKLYRQLLSNPAIRKRFTLYSYVSIDEQKEAMGLQTLEPSLANVREALHSYDIDFVVYGSLRKGSQSAFTLRIIRTTDGAVLMEEELHDSRNSNPLKDAEKVFAESRKPVYRTE